MPDNQSDKNKKTLKKLGLVVVLMFGFAYAMVPLYNTFCKLVGINGKTPGRVAVEKGIKVDKSRTITMLLLTTNNENLPWEFHSNVKKLTLHPGEIKRISYFAKNSFDKSMTVQAIPSVSPANAAKYIKKTECFCFRRQDFKPHEGRDMPVIFHVDPKLPGDINTITLSYTLFDLSKLLQTK